MSPTISPLLPSGGTTVAPVFHILASFFTVYQDNGLNDVTRDQTQLPKMACFDIYNNSHCFSLEAPWVSTERPVAEVPWSPDIMGTTFTLVTRNNRTFPVALDPGNLKQLIETPFTPGGPWKILVHGLESGMDLLWVKNLVNELLISGDYNVVLVDWSKGAMKPYLQAVANIRVVGVQLAYLIYNFHKYADVSMDLFHIIGHSLGAHAASYTGAHLKEYFGVTLNRITALDPAHPSFEKAPTVIRLDPSDASFVDVIHTDNNYFIGFPFTLGLQDAAGHVDFFPNGGKNQPGCESREVSCQHTLACTLFTESIRQSCPYMGVACSSHEEFLNGECWGCDPPFECIEMGMDAHQPVTQPHLSLYLLTREKIPHCGYHYRVSIEISNSTRAQDLGGEYGIIAIALEGVMDSVPVQHLSTGSKRYDVGETYHRVILGADVGDLRSIKVTFLYPRSILNPLPWVLTPPELHMASVSVQKLGDKKIWKYCFENRFQFPDVEHVLTTEKHLCSLEKV